MVKIASIKRIFGKIESLYSQYSIYMYKYNVVSVQSPQTQSIFRACIDLIHLCILKACQFLFCLLCSVE